MDAALIEPSSPSETISKNSIPLAMQFDPLSDDRADDDGRFVSWRSLTRVAMVAAAAATHFEHRKIVADPLAWMTSPRSMLAGRTALDACQERDDFLRAMILHGAELGLDIERSAMDEALADSLLSPSPMSARHFARSGSTLFAQNEPERRALFTATVVAHGNSGIVQAFAAVVARSPREAHALLSARLGSEVARDLDLQCGFDSNGLLAQTLLSPTTSDMLTQVATAPESPLADGLLIFVEHRFAA